MITQLERSCTSLLANESINTNQVSQRNGRGHYFVAAATVVVLLCISMQFANAGFRQESQVASANTRLELIDWHVSGLWVINSPVAWVKVTNYNNVPIHEITMEYQTFDTNGKPLDKGIYTFEGTVQPHTTRNFIEQYLGLVDLYSERLQLRLLSVKEVEPGASGH